MNRSTFISKLKSLNGNDLVTFIQQFGKKDFDIQTYLKQYDPMQHDVMDPIKRRDKWVMKPNGAMNTDGTPALQLQAQAVSRIAVDSQQDIAKSAAGILCANKIELQGTNEVVETIWNNNKLDLKTISTCIYWLSETEVAELWFRNRVDMDVLIMANSLGDKFYPVFDDLGDLICFGRSYKANALEPGQLEIKEFNYYEIYLDTEVTKGSDEGGIVSFGNWEQHGFKEIPIIYATRKKPIWHNAQTSIERFETSISNLCDTNDYFGSPTAVVKGKIISYADKGESGKIIEIDGESPNSEIKYLTWDQAPESIKLEWEKLQQIIYESTRTVNLSISNLKGLFGSAPSSYAIKLLFSPAHMQAAENEEIFGEYIQRRLNFLSGSKGQITPKFTYYLPRNDKEEQDMIVQGVSNGILSTESAVEQSVLTVDIATELKRIDSEQQASQIAAKELAAAQTKVIAPSNGNVKPAPAAAQ